MSLFCVGGVLYSRHLSAKGHLKIDEVSDKKMKYQKKQSSSRWFSNVAVIAFSVEILDRINRPSAKVSKLS